MTRLLRAGLQRAIDLFFPRDCVHCGEIVSEDSQWKYLCNPCAERLDWVRGPLCERCGHPYPGIENGQSCEHCEALDAVFSTGRCCVLHRDVGVSLIRALKYQRARHLADDLAGMVATNPELVAHLRSTVLVPVPLHPQRERTRGYNQSLVFAQALAGALPGVTLAPMLCRARSTPSQTQLPRAQRMKNVRGAFILAEGAVVRADLTYTVVDDVFTTGSTMNECCRALRKAGARSLKVMAFAHG